ncbi:hypothetical protein THASP1DRAFT_31305 [Thamnocephalis sphaerospora]|uniref:HTH myb-type domain-containing protein n=1 Tax=Thamnocephalis sphaerospora TaxID=78915 RepID=A0A4P9XLX0_9FUNG|nr:hypothetical protein THASP1DRAFT_31305 [Thamnocephalis sphaerospora]|eukprot:RKP06883.1 hypothetical protein THASP1DRAFT_31305 [Thamnocephalis sphaerospora]
MSAASLEQGDSSTLPSRALFSVVRLPERWEDAKEPEGVLAQTSDRSNNHAGKRSLSTAAIRPTEPPTMSKVLRPSTNALDPNENTACAELQTSIDDHVWTEARTEMLVQGCTRHGVGRWKVILNDADYDFGSMTSTDLREKFRAIFPAEYRRLYPEAASSERYEHATNKRPVPSQGFELGRTFNGRVRFSEEEDQRLWQGFVALGPKWSEIRTKYDLENRSSVGLRDRMRNRFPEAYQAAGYKLNVAGNKLATGLANGNGPSTTHAATAVAPSKPAASLLSKHRPKSARRILPFGQTLAKVATGPSSSHKLASSVIPTALPSEQNATTPSTSSTHAAHRRIEAVVEIPLAKPAQARQQHDAPYQHTSEHDQVAAISAPSASEDGLLAKSQSQPPSPTADSDKQPDVNKAKEPAVSTGHGYQANKNAETSSLVQQQSTEAIASKDDGSEEIVHPEPLVDAQASSPTIVATMPAAIAGMNDMMLPSPVDASLLEPAVSDDRMPAAAVYDDNDPFVPLSPTERLPELNSIPSADSALSASTAFRSTAYSAFTRSGVPSPTEQSQDPASAPPRMAYLDITHSLNDAGVAMANQEMPAHETAAPITLNAEVDTSVIDAQQMADMTFGLDESEISRIFDDAPPFPEPDPLVADVTSVAPRNMSGAQDDIALGAGNRQKRRAQLQVGETGTVRRRTKSTSKLPHRRSQRLRARNAHASDSPSSSSSESQSSSEDEASQSVQPGRHRETASTGHLSPRPMVEEVVAARLRRRGGVEYKVRYRPSWEPAEVVAREQEQHVTQFVRAIEASTPLKRTRYR